jgi:hypothetical protein
LIQRQIRRFCPNGFIADIFVGIFIKGNKIVAIGARALLF